MLPFELTKDTPYLALSGELWSVFYEYFNRNWSCYKGFPLYIYGIIKYKLEWWMLIKITNVYMHEWKFTITESYLCVLIKDVEVTK